MADSNESDCVRVGHRRVRAARSKTDCLGSSFLMINTRLEYGLNKTKTELEQFD